MNKRKKNSHSISFFASEDVDLRRDFTFASSSLRRASWKKTLTILHSFGKLFKVTFPPLWNRSDPLSLARTDRGISYLVLVAELISMIKIRVHGGKKKPDCSRNILFP